MGKLSSETLLIQEEKFKTAKKFRPYYLSQLLTHDCILLNNVYDKF